MNLRLNVGEVKVINPDTGLLDTYTADELLQEENALILQEILDGLPSSPSKKKTGKKIKERTSI